MATWNIKTNNITYLYTLFHRRHCHRQQAIRIYVAALKPFLLLFQSLNRYYLESLLNKFCSHLERFYCKRWRSTKNGNSFMFSMFQSRFRVSKLKLTGYVWFPAYVWIQLHADSKIEEHYHFFLLALCVQHDVHNRQFCVVPKIEPPNPPSEHQCRVRSHPVNSNGKCSKFKRTKDFKSK